MCFFLCIKLCVQHVQWWLSSYHPLLFCSSQYSVSWAKTPFYINMWESRLEFLSKTLVWGYRHKSLCLALDNFLDPSWAFLCIAAEKLRNMNKTKKKRQLNGEMEINPCLTFRPILCGTPLPAMGQVVIHPQAEAVSGQSIILPLTAQRSVAAA